MSLSKTILFTYPTFFNPERGGVERVTDVLAKSFIQRGYTVYYLHHRSDINISEYDYPAPVYFFPSTSLSSIENVEFYHRFLKEKKIDIIINQCGLHGDSKLYLNIGNNNVKTISVLHNNPLLNYDYLPEEVLQLRNNSFIERCKLIVRYILYPRIKKQYWDNRVFHFDFLFENTDVVCLLSNNYKKDIARVYHDKLDEAISIGNPVISDNLSFIENKEKIILFVGRLDKGQKRPDRLLKIWREIYKDFPSWKLVFLGDGKERRILEKKAKQLERVFFVGYKSPDEYYRKASILCLTSSFEGFPMVLNEAMQYGVVPILFNSFAAASDIIENNETGFLIKPFDIDAYTDKLRFLMQNEDKRLIMAKKGFESTKRFDIENITDQWENLFNRLIKEK